FAPDNIPTAQEYSVHRPNICADTAELLSATTGRLTSMFVRGVNAKTDVNVSGNRCKCQHQQPG
ncbi:hypothetical protein, partial [Bacteroides pyogenes]|uniref:hypothetical protein n=1 Tax=Bacteroides pyogenes TaxID=310300 RepID=UPI00243206FE